MGGGRWSLRHRVEPLADDEARTLFLDIAGTIPPGDPHLAELLHELGGVPLAICLTARRAARRTELAGLWAEWQRVGVDLAQWQGRNPSRLTSVARSIELSLRSPRLPTSGHRLLRILAQVLRPSCRQWPAPSHRLFAILGQLPAGLAPVDQDALLGREAFAAEDGLIAVGLAYHRVGRLDLLPPVRDHARRACLPKGADAVAWCRHFLTLARQQGDRILRGAGGAEALGRLAPEVANLEAALRAAAGMSLRKIAVAAVYATSQLLRASGAGSIAALRVLAWDCRNASDVRGEADCYLYAGVVASDRSDHVEARSLYEQACPLYQQVGDVQGEANCIRCLGDVALGRSDHGEAQVLYEQARLLYREVSDVQGEANCIQCLGDVALRRADHAGARVRYEQARLLYQEVNDVHGEASCIRSLGDIALRHSDYAKARALHEQARPLFQQAGDLLGEANCVLGLSRVAQAEGDAAAARALAAKALALYEHLHATQHVAIAHEDIARVTTGAECAEHVAAARAAWASMDLPDEAARVEREFA